MQVFGDGAEDRTDPDEVALSTVQSFEAGIRSRRDPQPN